MFMLLKLLLHRVRLELLEGRGSPFTPAPLTGLDVRFCPGTLHGHTHKTPLPERF